MEPIENEDEIHTRVINNANGWRKRFLGVPSNAKCFEVTSRESIQDLLLATTAKMIDNLGLDMNRAPELYMCLGALFEAGYTIATDDFNLAKLEK